MDRAHADVKIAYDTKMNHIMVLFSRNYHSNFVDRIPYKHKS